MLKNNYIFVSTDEGKLEDYQSPHLSKDDMHTVHSCACGEIRVQFFFLH